MDQLLEIGGLALASAVIILSGLQVGRQPAQDR
jgi:hypothetical protein